MYVGKKGFLSRYTVCYLFVSVFCFFFSKIIVDGVRGISYLGDAALDDFSFEKGTCNQTGIYRTVKNNNYNCLLMCICLTSFYFPSRGFGFRFS